MGSYSHTMVLSKLSNRFLKETLAWKPNDNMMLSVILFILANSSMSVISCRPWATWPPRVLPLGKLTTPASQVLSPSRFPLKNMPCETVAPIVA